MQLVEDLGAYSEELFDRQWPVSKQQRLAEAILVGGHRPGRAAFGQAEAEAQEGDIGRFSPGWTPVASSALVSQNALPG